MEDYIKTLEKELVRNANSEIALGQKAYMKNRFEFYGIKSPIRKEVQRPFLHKEALPPKDDLEGIVKMLWKKPQREFQYFSQELTFKYVKKMEKKDIALFEFMVVNKSWWDTVDYISVKLMGEYFTKYPDQRDSLIEKWIASGNMWLQRSALLFQLNYKEELDTEFLTYVINSLLGSKEFFINKAIGWVLRQYSKTNPDWVIDFTGKTKLANLSNREAFRLIK